jgi:hypothetical protein
MDISISLANEAPLIPSLERRWREQCPETWRTRGIIWSSIVRWIQRAHQERKSRKSPSKSCPLEILDVNVPLMTIQCNQHLRHACNSSFNHNTKEPTTTLILRVNMHCRVIRQRFSPKRSTSRPPLHMQMGCKFMKRKATTHNSSVSHIRADTSYNR